jgi:hypothetical protein
LENGIILKVHWFMKRNEAIDWKEGFCHNFNFGLAIKARAWKGVGWECNLGMWENLRE